MKRNWKWFLIIILGIIVVISKCPGLFNYFNKSQRSYSQSAKLSTKDKNWINIDLMVDFRNNGQFHGTVPYHISYHYSKKNPELFINYFDGLDYCRITRNNVDLVSLHNNTIISSDSWSSYLSLRNDMEAKFQYLPYYTYGLPTVMRCKEWEIDIKSHKDTIINNNKCKLFIGHTKKRLLQDPSNGKFNIPIQYECLTWINGDSQVDSVIAYNITQNEFNQVITYRIINRNYVDKSSYFDSIFDFRRSIYDNFSREDILNSNVSGKATKELNYGTNSFPIISINNDTTSISEFHGWLLLDLWMFGCGGCDNCFKTFKQETDSLGYRNLEKENIKILSVNALSDNLEMINNYAQKYRMEDIMYSSKGINTKLSLVNYAYPSYYLITPEKEIIWRSNYLGNYSELLEAKAEYEKQHKTKLP